MQEDCHEIFRGMGENYHKAWEMDRYNQFIIEITQFFITLYSISLVFFQILRMIIKLYIHGSWSLSGGHSNNCMKKDLFIEDSK